MTISPSSMTTMTRTNSRRTNRAPQAHNRRKKCRLRVGIFILRKAPEGQSPQARLPALSKSEILRLKKQVQGRCACTCSVTRAFSANLNASANAAPSFAAPRLLLQPTTKSNLIFSKKVLASTNRFRYSTNSLQQEATRVWRNWQTRTVQVRMGATP